MASQLLVSGSITQGPQSVTGTTVQATAVGTVPAGVTQIPLLLTPSPKQSSRRSSGNKVLASPGSFQTISGLGATDDVTTADTLYIKADGPVQLQLTQQNLNTGSPVVSVVNLYGTMLLELPTGGYLTGLAAQGACNLEYLFSGPA